MNTTETGRATTSRKTYQLVVDGHLDDHWSAWLGPVQLTRNDDGTSTLTVEVQDQSQLHGLLAGVRDIGATLLGLHVTGTATAVRPAPTSRRAVRSGTADSHPGVPDLHAPP